MLNFVYFFGVSSTADVTNLIDIWLVSNTVPLATNYYINRDRPTSDSL